MVGTNVIQSSAACSIQLQAAFADLSAKVGQSMTS